MKKIPIIMIWSRVPMGLAIVLMAVFPFGSSRAVIITLIATGLVSDILDGIIARRLGVSSEKLRRLDSSIDQVFWIAVIGATFLTTPVFFKAHLIEVVLLLAAEALCYIVSYARFGKEVATHAISSKIWTLSLFATLVQLITTGNSTWLFQVCFYLGLLTRIEIVLILMLIRNWTNDVPSVYHAVLIRNNKAIKRNKYFNG